MLILLTALSMVGEFWWIRIVYRHFPVLRVDDVRRQSRKKRAGEEEQPLLARTEIAKTGRWERTCKFFKEEASAWGEFIRLPIFWGTPVFLIYVKKTHLLQLPSLPRFVGSTRSEWVRHRG